MAGNFEKAANLHNSLRLLTRLLCKHYGTKVIVLIDEYDVPLDKAHQNRYYPQTVQLIRSIFSQALKTNPNLYFAVITGCLRIAKESIFTGLNNLKVRTIADFSFAEYFGFTNDEVKQMLRSQTAKFWTFIKKESAPGIKKAASLHTIKNKNWRII